jgi:hypothetical protein
VSPRPKRPRERTRFSLIRLAGQVDVIPPAQGRVVFLWGAKLPRKDVEFWARVRARRQAACESIKASRPAVAYCRPLSEVEIDAARRKAALALLPPAGSPPYMFRLAFEVAGRRQVSRAENDEARRLFLQRAALRKFNVPHDVPHDSRAEFAMGVSQLERLEAGRRAFNRAVVPASPADGAAAIGPWQQGAGAISAEELSSYSVEALPDELIVSPETRSLLARILAKSPGRKRGRPPDGRRAMTDAERARKRRRQVKLAELEEV